MDRVYYFQIFRSLYSTKYSKSLLYSLTENISNNGLAIELRIKSKLLKLRLYPKMSCNEFVNMESLRNVQCPVQKK